MDEQNIVSSPFTPIDIPNISFGEYLLKKYQSCCDLPILVEALTDECLTGNQLIAEANIVAMALLRSGVRKSDIICCFSANNVSYVKVKLAAYFLGVTLYESSPMNNVREMESQFSITEPTYLFASQVNLSVVEKLLAKNTVKHPKLIVVFGGSDLAIIEQQNYISYDEFIREAKAMQLTLEKIPYFKINPKQDIAEIVYTSGTSGLSKAAMITHYAFVASIETFMPLNLSVRDSGDQLVILIYFSLAHSSGTVFIPSYMTRGVKVVLMETFDEQNVLDAIEKYRVNCMYLTPSFGYKLADGVIGNNHDLSSLRLVYTGGTHFSSKAAQTLINKFKIIFRHMYGTTEFFSLLWNIADHYIAGSCGQLTANTELRIIDVNSGENLAEHKDGEICFRGPTLFSGYMKNESATKEAIDTNGWYHTGDIGHYDECGNIYITDRIKELIKYEIYSVSPADIELFLLQNKAVHNAVVVGVDYITGISLPRAYVCLNPGFSVTAEQLRDSVKENMASKNQLRGGVVIVDNMVKTLIGKIDRKYYKKLANDSSD